MPPGKNPFVFVEFKNDQCASKARRAIFLDDKLGIKRKELGDAYLEITYSKKSEKKKVDLSGILGNVPDHSKLFTVVNFQTDFAKNYHRDYSFDEIMKIVNLQYTFLHKSNS